MSRYIDVPEDLAPERYELREKPPYRFELSRRTFLELLGAGLLVTTTVRVPAARAQGSSSSRRRTVAGRLHIGEDGTVTVMTSKVEVGQGSRTELTQAVAEELHLPMERIRLVMADTAVVPMDGGTFGSLTTPRTVPAVRKAAATAREILIDLARKDWGDTDRSRLAVRDGAVVDPATQRSLSYAELAHSRDLTDAFNREPSSDVSVVPVSEWKVLGTPQPRASGREIVTGAHRYPSDIARPDMLFGQLLRPPSFGATLVSVALDPAEAMANVVAVRDGTFVGCAAPTSFAAQQAVEAIAETATWETAEHPPSEELFRYLKEKASAGGRRPRVRSKGSVEEGMAAAERTLKATYEVAYVQHAPLEPRAAVADWQNGSVTVWTGTQRPHGVQAEVARAFNLSRDRVRVIVPDTGGGFGGKHTGEVAVEAARLARVAGRPVSLCWSREEEFTWAYFRPAGLLEVEAGLDAKNTVVAWDFVNINSGASALEAPYAFPNARVRFYYCDSPLREGSYRALASTANTFAREVFMDELAGAAEADPLAYRLAHLEDPRLRAVLEAAAERFGWKERRKSPSTETGFGLACGTEKGSYTAACVEVAVDRTRGKIDVRQVCQAFECGAICDPENLRSQVVGCIIMGLGGALKEEIRFQDGRILNARFSDYPVPRFKDVPEIETLLLNRPDLPSAGAGETPIIAISPAIANAVFHATGIRLRSMPLRGEDLKAA